MPVSDLMMEGVRLMGLGMGIVFAFLLILIFTLKAMSRLAQALEARHGPAPVAAGDAAVAVDEADDAELVAVISAAIALYRATASRQTR